MSVYHQPYILGSQGPWIDSTHVGEDHNYYLNKIVSDILNQNLHRGTPPYWAYIAQQLYDNNVINQYEIGYISNIATSIGTPTTPINTVLANFQTLWNQILNDPQVTTPALRAIINVGMMSATYGAQQTLNPNPPALASIAWGQVWSDDLAGAGLGAAIGSTAGPGGTAIGAAIGGVAASAVTVLIQTVCP